MAYAYRKGMRKNASHYGMANYGEIWWVRSKTLAGCPPMNEHYKKFQRYKAKKKECGFWDRKCKRKYENLMEAEERRGKNAKKQCEVQEHAAELALENDDFYMEEEEFSLAPSYLQEGSTYLDTPPQQQAPYQPPYQPPAPQYEDPYYEEPKAGPDMKVILGAGAGVVLLLLLLRRR